MVKPLPPSLTMARDFGWEESKAQGAVCKAKTHRNSAIKDLFVISAVNFEIL
jgi:hypothetical protein